MHSHTEENPRLNLQQYQPLVLIIDNDRDNLLLASCVIDSMGMNYVVLEEPEQSLEVIAEISPDIILLDIVMPKISGLEITRQIKQNPSIASIPIIAVTGLTPLKYKTQLIDAGCDDYLYKPYLIEELEAKVYDNLKCLLI